MPLQELTGRRDLTFSAWHRAHLPADCTWIDIDCCHYCRYCSSLLAVMELVRSPDADSLIADCRRKTAAIAGRVGIRLKIPVFKIAYTGEPLAAAAVMRVGRPEVQQMTPDDLARFIDRLHDCEFCRTHHNGRFGRR